MSWILTLRSPKEILSFIRNLRSHAEFVETSTKVSVIVADPTDNIFLECAIDGRFMATLILHSACQITLGLNKDGDRAYLPVHFT